MAWAFARTHWTDAELLAALAGGKDRWASEFNDQNTASAAWAFARTHQTDAKPFEALARTAERWVSEFNDQDLANTAWAFPGMHQSDAKLLYNGYGKDCGAMGEQALRPESRQHSMGVCKNVPGGCTAIGGIGKDGGALGERVQ